MWMRNEHYVNATTTFLAKTQLIQSKMIQRNVFTWVKDILSVLYRRLCSNISHPQKVPSLDWQKCVRLCFVYKWLSSSWKGGAFFHSLNLSDSWVNHSRSWRHYYRKGRGIQKADFCRLKFTMGFIVWK